MYSEDGTSSGQGSNRAEGILLWYHGMPANLSTVSG